MIGIQQQIAQNNKFDKTKDFYTVELHDIKNVEILKKEELV